MNKDEQLSLAIAKSNDLIRNARYNLSAKELTLVDFMVSRIKPEDKEFITLETTLEEINDHCNFGRGSRNFQATKDSLLSLRNKGFWLQVGEKKVIATSWLSKATIDDGRCELKIDSELAPYLLNLIGNGNYTQSYFRITVNLKSSFSKRLYEYLLSFRHRGRKVEAKREDLMEIFEKKDMEWRRFNDKVLKVALKEINEKTDMRVETKNVKEGRSIESVIFFISDVPYDGVLLEDLPKVPLFNWLEQEQAN